FFKTRTTIKISHPGLLCEQTERILKAGLISIICILPIDTNEKQQQFDIILAGTLIYAMAYQDKTYGKQSHYNNRFLYPGKTLDELLDITKVNSSDIEATI